MRRRREKKRKKRSSFVLSSPLLRSSSPSHSTMRVQFHHRSATEATQRPKKYIAINRKENTGFPVHLLGFSVLLRNRMTWIRVKHPS